MSTDLLFQNFATLATALEGVPRLRELILRLAIYGKLETHDSSDSSVLLNEIKGANDGSLGIFELINLPKGWKWTKLGNISKIGQGGTPSTNFPEYWNGTVPWLRSGDIKFNRIKNANETISEIGLQNSAAQLCPIGTVMLAMTGQGVTRGRAAILDIEASANQSCAHIILDQKIMIPEFLFNFFKTEYWNIRTLDKGTGQPGINTKIIKIFDIPVPPLAEQHRIVAKVDRLMALCDDLEARQQQERAGCLRLGTASLMALQNADSPEEFERQWAQVCDAFDLILDCPENVAVLRQTILKLAIYGKLKTQNINDKTVKIENNNVESKIQALGIFKRIDLPKKWIWTKLGNISKVGQGGTPSTNFPEYWNGSVPWLRSGEIKFNRIKKANETISGLGLNKSAATLCPIGTVMLAMTGQGVTRGRAAILDIEASANQSCAHIILDKDKMIPEFLFYFFKTEYWNIRTLDKGTGQPGLNTKIIKMFDIPVPPLAEQHRIVAIVDRIMALCDALESHLKERAGVQGRLAGAVVKQVANG